MPDKNHAVEGRQIPQDASIVCPDPDLCDVRVSERYEAYVERHCSEHGLDFSFGDDAERNLGLNCFYFDHKYIYGNPTLTPYPHWEIHAFIAEGLWSESALEQRLPQDQRTYQVPRSDLREVGAFRRFKQVEVSREVQKTSAARAYTLFRSKREYFVNDRRNYRIIVRSATTKNSSDTREIVLKMATGCEKISQLYGIWLLSCPVCGGSSQVPEQRQSCPECGNEKKLRFRWISLVNMLPRAGGTGKDKMSFRWLTDVADPKAAYSLWSAGLRTETTGQRPDLYILDDPQTETNSKKIRQRIAIIEAFDEITRQLEKHTGEFLVLDTRKYVDDFAGKIRQEPLISQFYTLHRPVEWITQEPHRPPYVIWGNCPSSCVVVAPHGHKYYYPVKGDGTPALDRDAVEALATSGMADRKLSAEYYNDPLDKTRAQFQREQFILVARGEAPIEIRYGLGSALTTFERDELTAQRVRIMAYNACHAPSIEEQKALGAENCIVALRVARDGRVYVTKISCGRWNMDRNWEEIENLSEYNAAQFTDYQMRPKDTHIRIAQDKWLRTKNDASKEPIKPTPMRFANLPTNGKESRIDQMQSFLPIYILEDAATPEVIESYIMQWLGKGVSDRDEGPNATSRLISFFQVAKRDEIKPQEEVVATTGVPLTTIKAMAGLRLAPANLWGQRGGMLVAN